jgi:hypothetical protein
MIEILIVLIVGIFLVYTAVKVNEKRCPLPRVEYRFIPRTLNEELENPVKVSDIFGQMFDDTYNIFGRSNGNTLSRI